MIIKMNHTNYTHYHEMLQKDADIKYPFRDKERDLYCKGGSCTDFLHLNAFGREI